MSFKFQQAADWQQIQFDFKSHKKREKTQNKEEENVKKYSENNNKVAEAAICPSVCACREIYADNVQY